jgi:hypothetical protein
MPRLDRGVCRKVVLAAAIALLFGCGQRYAEQRAACYALLPPFDSSRAGDPLYAERMIAANHRELRCLNAVDNSELRDEEMTVNALRGAGASLQATGDDMLKRPRPTLSAPPSPPSAIGPPANLGASYLPPPVTAPPYCTNSPLGQTTACPH